MIWWVEGSCLGLCRLWLLGGDAIKPVSGHWEALQPGFSGQALQHCRGVPAAASAGCGAPPAGFVRAVTEPLRAELQGQLIKKWAILHGRLA